jgi:hypothetical protein
MKSHGESINGVFSPSVLGAGITMITKLLTAKFTKGFRGRGRRGGGGEGGEGGEGGGLFGGEVVTKLSPVNMEGNRYGTA